MDTAPHPRVKRQIKNGLLKAVPKHFVSNLGRVRRPSQRDSYGYKQQNGYHTTGLHKKTHRQHKLVLRSFDGLPAKGETEVDHLNGNRGDNRRINLGYVTSGENIRRGLGTNPDRKSDAGKKSKPVRGRKVGTVEWVPYPSTREAARQTGTESGSVSQCCNGHGKRLQTHGYEFQWAEPNEKDVLDDEEWRDVGYVNEQTCKKTGVSTFGRYRNSWGVVSTPTPHKDGYCYVGVNGQNHKISILIAKKFLPPALPGQTEVHHKDHDPSNNRLDNLEWVTREQNVQASWDNNLDRKTHAEALGWPLFHRVQGTAWPSEPSFASCKEAVRKLGIPYKRITRNADARWAGKSPDTVADGHEFMWQPREDLPGEVWVPLLLPTQPATKDFQPFDEARRRVKRL